jgi:hypothetical protein
VSYYLYRRVRVINLGVDKFPVLSGFLREDLELPVVGQKLDIEAVTLDGVAYHRSLLARYAAYPLKEGKLPIDPMAVKVNYFGAESGLDSEDDPMFNFFRQANPLVGTAQSDPITVEVSPLPPGQPDNFTGGIGDFQIAASVDKLSVNANDALTLTIRVDGRGSTRAIELPQTQWPPGVQLFDSKGTVKSNRGGSSEKIFENILIPRQPGTVLIPPIHLSFYDPVKKEYVTRSTTAISINVGPASGNSLSNAAASPAPATLTGSASTSTSSVQPAFHGLKTSDLGTPKKSDWFVKLSGLAVACIVLVGVALGVAFILRSNGGLSQSQTKRVDSWKQVADLPTGTRDQLVTAYDQLSMAIYDSIDQAFSIGARSLPRGELQRILVQDGKVSQQQWDNISALLEYSETVRYALSVGAISEQVARQDFSRKSEEAREILKKIAVISS